MRLRSTLFLLVSLFLVTSCDDRSAVEKARDSAIILTSSQGGNCSGSQVQAPSGKIYILTAAHCEPLIESGSILAAQEGKRPIPRRVLEISDTTDLMLLEALPDAPALAVAESAPAVHAALTAFTHGQGLSVYKAQGELIEQSEAFVVDSIVWTPEQHAACVKKPKNRIRSLPTPFGISVEICGTSLESYKTFMPGIVGGSSGGMAVNDRGQLIGVVYGGNNTTHFSLIVSWDDVTEFLAPY